MLLQVDVIGVQCWSFAPEFFVVGSISAFLSFPKYGIFVSSFHLSISNIVFPSDDVFFWVGDLHIFPPVSNRQENGEM